MNWQKWIDFLNVSTSFQLHSFIAFQNFWDTWSSVVPHLSHYMIKQWPCRQHMSLSNLLDGRELSLSDQNKQREEGGPLSFLLHSITPCPFSYLFVGWVNLVCCSLVLISKNITNNYFKKIQNMFVTTRPLLSLHHCLFASVFSIFASLHSPCIFLINEPYSLENVHFVHFLCDFSCQFLLSTSLFMILALQCFPTEGWKWKERNGTGWAYIYIYNLVNIIEGNVHQPLVTYSLIKTKFPQMGMLKIHIFRLIAVIYKKNSPTLDI